MAVNELNRDFLRLLHICDQIEDIMAGTKLREVDVPERRMNVGGMVMHLESEMLDDKWVGAGKDVTRINEVIATGRAYWKSTD